MNVNKITSKETNAIIMAELKTTSKPDKIEFITGFFRAKKGDICYGDQFLASSVPDIHKIIKKWYKTMTLEDVDFFINSKINEVRFFAHEIVDHKYHDTTDLDLKKKYIEYLIKNIETINHWNLTDNIAGIFSNYCQLINDNSILNKFNKSKSIWQRRIAVVSQIPIIKKGNIGLAMEYITSNLTDQHEYMQKANGWALREVGKIDEKLLISFLKTNIKIIPSITKTYATEKLRLTYDVKNLLK